MGLFSKSSNGTPKTASQGKRQHRRAEAWECIASQKKKEFGRGSPEYKEAQRHAKEELRKVPEWRTWTPFG
jgi:hypothetical protein